MNAPSNFAMSQAEFVLSNVGYKDGWNLALGRESGRAYLLWQFTSPDYTKDGAPQTQWKSRKWFLSEHMTQSELVQTAFAAALMAEEHEAREAFSYCGKHVFNPHIALTALMGVCNELEIRP